MSAPAELSIRPATPEEQPQLEALQRRASMALGEHNEQLEAHPEAIQLPVELIEQGGMFVAEIHEQVAGFAAVIIDDDIAELDGLFVEPELWRQGVGAALVDVAVHEARRQGLAMSRAQRAERPTRALSVAMPVLAYICRYSFEISRNASLAFVDSTERDARAQMRGKL